MTSLAHYALPGIIVLASVGAFLMCLSVIRYGFAPLEEDPDEVARRLLVTRLAHAAAAVCFAGTALLAVAAWSVRGAPATAARRAETDALGEVQALVGEQAREITRLTDALHRLQLEVEERLAAAESKPRGGEAGQPAAERNQAVERGPSVAQRNQPAVERGPSGPPRGQPAAERGQPAAESRRAGAEIRRPAPVSRPEPAEGEQAYTLPAGAAARTVTAIVEGVRVQVEMHPLKEHETAYVVRLTGAGRRPLSGAEVSIQGQTADGRPVQTTLAPAGEPGVHRGRLPNIAQDLRLRVAGPGTRFEVSLAGDTRW
ncbi:MAG TPA: hypothetical protein VNO23_15900 [Candidatus Binatia bacterium]|nr:hypothetical protein [Candidatus Binatia bacterium]